MAVRMKLMSLAVLAVMLSKHYGYGFGLMSGSILGIHGGSSSAFDESHTDEVFNASEVTYATKNDTTTGIRSFIEPKDTHDTVLTQRAGEQIEQIDELAVHDNIAESIEDHECKNSIEDTASEHLDDSEPMLQQLDSTSTYSKESKILYIQRAEEQQHQEEVFSVYALRSKVETSVLPLFDFRFDIDRLLSTATSTIGEAQSDMNGAVIPASELEVENVLHQYLSQLRDKYFVEFAQLCANAGHEYHRCHSYMNSTLTECNAAMAAALPTPIVGGKRWSYQGHLAELEADLARYLVEVAAINEAQGITAGAAIEESPSLNKTQLLWKKLRSSKWMKRAKWLTAQSLVLAVNIGQFELQRFFARRAAEKRLATVPEFPLL